MQTLMTYFLKIIRAFKNLIEEFEVISQIAGKIQKKVKALIRINGYDIKNVTAEGVFTAGLWTKFGVPLKEIPTFIKKLDKHSESLLLKSLNVDGY